MTKELKEAAEGATPRTDAQKFAPSSGPHAEVVPADFARQLERELEAYKMAFKGLHMHVECGALGCQNFKGRGDNTLGYPVPRETLMQLEKHADSVHQKIDKEKRK